MKLNVEKSGRTARITVEGAIQSVQDAMDVKKALSDQVAVDPGVALELRLPDASVLPSSVIGALLRLVEIDKAQVSLQVGQEVLRESLKKLNFDAILHVRSL